MRLSFYMGFLALLLFSACQPKSTPQTSSTSLGKKSQSMIPVAKSAGRGQQLICDEATANQIFQSVYQQEVDFSTLGIVSFNERFYYLGGKLKNDDNPSLGAIALQWDEAQSAWCYQSGQSQWYLCRSNGCTDYNFSPTPEGAIEGCACLSQEAVQCNFSTGK
jgi:hypothetical protein